MGIDVRREMEAFRAALSERGLPETRQRLRLAETVFSTHEHFTADDLVKWVRKRGTPVGRVTVYRTLKVMVDAGLVEERPFRKDRTLYEHVVGHRHHDHMVCVDCGRIVEFESARIEDEQARAARKHDFQVLYHSHTLFGYCTECAKKRRKGAGTQGAGRNGRAP